ncbi:hypothetical protein PS850_05230 [Pseudomonas fluorescens]|nr:hypothetical protein PS850_05230 [Pseudomonas fluorescens]
MSKTDAVDYLIRETKEHSKGGAAQLAALEGLGEAGGVQAIDYLMAFTDDAIRERMRIWQPSRPWVVPVVTRNAQLHNGTFVQCPPQQGPPRWAFLRRLDARGAGPGLPFSRCVL